MNIILITYIALSTLTFSSHKNLILYYVHSRSRATDTNCIFLAQCTASMKCTRYLKQKLWIKFSNFLASLEQPGLNQKDLCKKQIIFRNLDILSCLFNTLVYRVSYQNIKEQQQLAVTVLIADVRCQHNWVRIISRCEGISTSRWLPYRSNLFRLAQYGETSHNCC